MSTEEDPNWRFPSSAVHRPTLSNDVLPCTDIIEWTGSANQQAFLNKYLHVPPNFDFTLRQKLLGIIHCNWDTFAPEGTSHPMLGYGFCIDTTYSTYHTQVYRSTHLGDGFGVLVHITYVSNITICL